MKKSITLSNIFSCSKNDQFWALDISPDMNKFTIVGRRGKVYAYRFQTQRCTNVYRLKNKSVDLVTEIRYITNQLIVIKMKDILLATKHGKWLRKFKSTTVYGHLTYNAFQQYMISSDPCHLQYNSEDFITLWCPFSAQIIAKFAKKTGKISKISQSLDSNLLAIARGQQLVELWNQSTQQQIAQLSLNQVILNIDFTDKYIIVSSLTRIQINDHKLGFIYCINHPYEVNSIAVSQIQNLLYLASSDQKIVIFDLKLRRQVKYTQQPLPLNCICLSSKENVLVSGSTVGDIQVVEVKRSC